MAPRRAPRSQRLNRRAFLGKTALLSGVWPLLQSGPALPGRSADSARLFELGTVTYNLGRNWGLDRLIEICEETNFKAVELRTTHAHGVEPTLSKRQRAAVRRRFQKTPVQLAGLGTVCEFHSPDA
ncbi:MAG: sugar phosphate isomerase/epimerase, partial [Acidobacteriota bacterium]